MAENQGMSDVPNCGGGIKTRALAESAWKELGHHSDILDILRNRLPLWATFAISFLTCIIGVLSTCLLLVIKFGSMPRVVTSFFSCLYRYILC